MKHFKSHTHARHTTATPSGSAPQYRQNYQTTQFHNTLAEQQQKAKRRKSLFALAALVLAIISVTLVAISMSQCGSSSLRAVSVPEVETYVSPYNWDGMVEQDGRFIYSEDGEIKSQVGIDISELQGSIDWNAVAADGISFAMVRLGNRGYTEGGLFADANAQYNLDEAQAAGLACGAYFFSQATTVEEAREEADMALQQLNGRSLELPVAFDHESVAEANARANNLDRETLTQCALAFCERIEAGGYDVMIYGNRNDLLRYNLKELEGIPLWLAEYDQPHPTAQMDIVMWQFSGSGSVAGINTPVDMNLRFTDAL